MSNYPLKIVGGESDELPLGEEGVVLKDQPIDEAIQLIYSHAQRTIENGSVSTADTLVERCGNNEKDLSLITKLYLLIAQQGSLFVDGKIYKGAFYRRNDGNYKVEKFWLISHPDRERNEITLLFKKWMNMNSETLGTGTGSTVYKGYHLINPNSIALRMKTQKEIWKNPEILEKENDTLKALLPQNQAGIVEIDAIAQYGSLGQITLMKRYKYSLDQYMEQTSPLSLKEQLDYAQQIIYILRTLKELKKVHRDIKPDNLLIDEQGQLILSDFEYCCDEFEQTEGFPGTGNYANLHQIISNSEVNTSAMDFWSAGCVIWNVMTDGIMPPWDDLIQTDSKGNLKGWDKAWKKFLAFRDSLESNGGEFGKFLMAFFSNEPTIDQLQESFERFKISLSGIDNLESIIEKAGIYDHYPEPDDALYAEWKGYQESQEPNELGKTQ